MGNQISSKPPQNLSARNPILTTEQKEKFIADLHESFNVRNIDVIKQRNKRVSVKLDANKQQYILKQTENKHCDYFIKMVQDMIRLQILETVGCGFALDVMPIQKNLLPIRITIVINNNVLQWFVELRLSPEPDVVDNSQLTIQKQNEIIQELQKTQQTLMMRIKELESKITPLPPLAVAIPYNASQVVDAVYINKEYYVPSAPPLF